MQIPPEVVFANMDPSDLIRTRVEDEIAKLEQFNERITRCRVIVEAPHRHRRKGKLYSVRIHLTLPGHGELDVNRSPGRHQAHQDVYVAIRDAFAAARRRLQDLSRQRQGQVKLHESPAHGRVVRLFPENNYGFIESVDGRELYFHANSVIEGFERLEVGSEVRFSEEMGREGPQATTVHTVGKHHPG